MWSLACSQPTAATAAMNGQNTHHSWSASNRRWHHRECATVVLCASEVVGVMSGLCAWQVAACTGWHGALAVCMLVLLCITNCCLLQRKEECSNTLPEQVVGSCGGTNTACASRTLLCLARGFALPSNHLEPTTIFLLCLQAMCYYQAHGHDVGVGLQPFGERGWPCLCLPGVRGQR